MKKNETKKKSERKVEGHKISRRAIYNILFKFLILFAYLTFNNLYAATLQNLSVGGSLTPGGEITVYFQINAAANQTGEFAIGYSYSSTPYRCNSNFIAFNNTVYNRLSSGTTTFPYGDASNSEQTKTVNNRAYTSQEISNGGAVTLNSYSSAVWRSVTVTANIPPEVSGTIYLFVASDENSGLKWNCNSGTTYDDLKTTTVTVTGTPTFKLDLAVCDGGSNSTKMVLQQSGSKIYNWGESAVQLNDIAFRLWITRTASDTWTINGLTGKTYYSGGTGFGNSAWTGTSTTAYTSQQDCGDGRLANTYLQRQWNVADNSSDRGVVLPPNGGYIAPDTEWNYTKSPASINQSTYYSRLTGTSAPSCTESSQTSGNKYFTIYAKNSLVCEYINATTQDTYTGEEPCGTTGCEIPIVADKSASRTTATIGDTITYCITATNNTGDTAVFDIWDTIPATLTYVGCDYACTQSGSLVYWENESIANGTSITRCFWVTVSSLPFYEHHEFIAYLREHERVDARRATKESVIFAGLSGGYLSGSPKGW